MFYRANSKKADTIEFDDLTSYLIDHEIDSMQNQENTNFEYNESAIQDQTTHNNYIDKIFYFARLDKVILYEQNNKALRIYEAKTMKHLTDVVCPGSILAVEFITDKDVIAVALSDRTIVFYDANSAQYKTIRKIIIPST